MLSVADHVNKTGTEQPTGIIEAIDEETSMAIVRWGVADNKTYKTNLPLDQLQPVPYKILSTEDVQLREIEKQELKRHNIFEDDKEGTP